MHLPSYLHFCPSPTHGRLRALSGWRASTSWHGALRLSMRLAVLILVGAGSFNFSAYSAQAQQSDMPAPPATQPIISPAQKPPNAPNPATARPPTPPQKATNVPVKPANKDRLQASPPQTSPKPQTAKQASRRRPRPAHIHLHRRDCPCRFLARVQLRQTPRRRLGYFRTGNPDRTLPLPPTQFHLHRRDRRGRLRPPDLA